jgi:hypothetical protein
VKRFPAPEVPATVVAVTVTAPALWAGEVTETCVLLTKVTVEAGIVVPPNVTVVAPETNPLPVRVTVVPPLVSPELGVTLVTMGVVGLASTKDESNELMVLDPEVVKFVNVVVA